MDLFFFTNLSEWILKVKFLHHYLHIKEQFFFLLMSVYLLLLTNKEIFSLTSFKVGKKLQLIFYIPWRFRAGQSLHGEIAFLVRVEESCLEAYISQWYMHMDIREKMFCLPLHLWQPTVFNYILYRQIMPSGNKERPQGSGSILVTKWLIAVIFSFSLQINTWDIF